MGRLRKCGKARFLKELGCGGLRGWGQVDRMEVWMTVDSRV
jgi:hypothetical protein